MYNVYETSQHSTIETISKESLEMYYKTVNNALIDANQWFLTI